MKNPASSHENPQIPGDFSARLQLHELGTIDDASATLSFERIRPIRLPWREMITATNTTLADSAAHASGEIRRVIEEARGVAGDRALVAADIK